MKLLRHIWEYFLLTGYQGPKKMEKLFFLPLSKIMRRLRLQKKHSKKEKRFLEIAEEISRQASE